MEFDYTRDLLTLSSDNFKTFLLTTTTVHSGETRSYLRFHRFGMNGFFRRSRSMEWRRTCPSESTNGRS